MRWVPESRTWLLVLHVLEIVGLSLWVGGLMVIVGAVIPAVFNAGMETGGRLLTRVFDGYDRLVGAVAAILVATALCRTWMSKRFGVVQASVGRVELGVLSTMIATYAVIVLWLGPESVTLQEHAFAAKCEDAKEAAYEAFFRSHSVVRGLYMLNLSLGIALVTLKVRQWTSP